MRRAYIAIVIALIIQPRLWAVDPDTHLEKQKALYFDQIDEAEKELLSAKKLRNKKFINATRKYIEELNKVKIYWTKKGNLEKALEIKKQVTDLQRILDSGESIKKPSGVEKAMLQADGKHDNENDSQIVKKAIVKVSSKQITWQPTGLYVEKGQRLKLQVDGRIAVGRDMKKHTGTHGKWLSIRIGDGKSFDAYSKYGARIFSDSAGEIQFRIDDSIVSDNNGIYIVSINAARIEKKIEQTGKP